MKRRRVVELLVVRWWFAATVATAIAVGLAAALTVAAPSEIPTVALGALPVYRVEVGAAVFFGLYLATVAFALATHNRGFTEIGTSGFKARDLADTSKSLAVEDVATELLEEFNEQILDLRGGLRNVS